jgi:TolA-binding protein
VNIFRPKLVLESDAVVGKSQPFDRESFWVRRKRFARKSAAERLERDIARGYSINVKQVVLAFAVEFWIIALIIVGTYLLISDSGSLSNEAIFGALLFPSALAMVELARVPLAIAVRTQEAWHIKLFAALGVAAAITVTSFSLSQLAFKSFDNRLIESNAANDRLIGALRNQRDFQNKIAQVQHDIDQKEDTRKNIIERLKGLEEQLTKISSNTGQTCKNILDQEGKPIIGTDGKPAQQCSPYSTPNQNQLNAVKNQIASTKKELAVAEADVKEAQGRVDDPKAINDEVGKAETDYRKAVSKSVLHSYTSTIRGKAVAEVTESEVKDLEKYLIFIPSIAAALASTFIAITAVRRIRPPDPEPITTIPEDAAAYVFGPLLEALKREARDTVRATIDERAKATPPP